MGRHELASRCLGPTDTVGSTGISAVQEMSDEKRTDTDGAVEEERTFTLQNKSGLHLRAAGKLAEAAGRFQCEIRVGNLDRFVDGKSIVDVINSSDAKSPHESFYWQLGRGKNAQWVVRKGEWKLLGNPQDRRDPSSLGPNDRLFLANLETDKTESKNLAAEHPQVVDELKSLQTRFAQSIASETAN